MWYGKRRMKPLCLETSACQSERGRFDGAWAGAGEGEGEEDSSAWGGGDAVAEEAAAEEEGISKSARSSTWIMTSGRLQSHFWHSSASRVLIFPRGEGSAELWIRATLFRGASSSAISWACFADRVILEVQYGY